MSRSAAATREYRQGEDVVGRFIEDCCTEGEDLNVGTTVLYEAFKNWLESNGHRTWTSNRFGRELTQKRFQRTEVPDGPHRKKWVRLGLTLDGLVARQRADADADADEDDDDDFDDELPCG